MVRTPSTPGGAVRTIRIGKFVNGTALFWARGRIVFDDGAPHIVGLHGGKPKRLVFPPCVRGDCGLYSPIVTPNREYVAFQTQGSTPSSSNGGIALLRLKPGRSPVVVSSPLYAEEGSGVSDWILGFSPNGKQLVFSRSPFVPPDSGLPAPTGPTVLMAVRLNGGDSVSLVQSGIPGASLVPSDVSQAQWSPDGRWVAFVRGPFGRTQSVEVVATTGASAPHVAGTCPDPRDFLSGFSWSPTSELIAFYCVNRRSGLGGGELMTMRPDGTQLTNPLSDDRLTAFSYYQGEPQPQWSPNGSRLLILAQRLGHQTIHVWTIRPNGHDLVRLG